MREEFRVSVERLVVKKIRDLRSREGFGLKRIVLFSSVPVSNPTLVFNHTQNRFFNQQYVIDNSLPIVIIPSYGRVKQNLPGYNPETDKIEGDYTIDVGAFLSQKLLKPSSYLES